MSHQFHYCQVHGINRCNSHHHYPHIHRHYPHIRQPESKWGTAIKIGFVTVGVLCAISGTAPVAGITAAVVSALGGGKQS
jgi:hypothetical protein